MTTIRRLAPYLLACWAAAVALLTLTPAPFTPPLTLEEFLCVGCGSRDTSDILVNWILFLPGGALLAIVLGTRRALASAVLLTCTVETLQIGIPGRDPALQDLLANTLGALTGAYVVRHSIGPRARLTLAVLAGLAWLAPVVLLIPMTSSADLYGQWTPAFENLEVYQGRVLAASIGGAPVGSHILSDKPAVDSAIVGRMPVEIQLRAGPPPASLSPVFQVVDADQASLVSLAASGEDLILSGNNPSRILRLDQPEVRWRGAMAGVAAGDTVAVRVERGRDSLCMSVGARARCGLAPSLADGWGHLSSLGGAPAWLDALAGLLWCTGLGVVLGATAGTLRDATVRGAGLAILGYTASLASPDVTPDSLHAGLLAAACILGHFTRRFAAVERLETIA